jgi:hypothetical protein
MLDFSISNHDQTNERPNCMKRFWTLIKHRRSDGRQIPPLKSDGTLHSEPTETEDIVLVFRYFHIRLGVKINI